MSFNVRILRVILSIIALYVLLLFFVPSVANFVLSIILVVLVPVLILRQVFMNHIYKQSINIVGRRFVCGNNAINNEHCTVMYTPDEHNADEPFLLDA